MPWKDVDMMTLRQEFTALAQQDGVNFSALCARFGISRKTGYKWRERSMTQGPAGLQDCSRRPCNTPLRTSQANEELVVKMRLKHPPGEAARFIAACSIRVASRCQPPAPLPGFCIDMA